MLLKQSGTKAIFQMLARRLLAAFLLLLVVSGLTFALIQLAPGDFLSDMKVNPQLSQETIAALRQQYGLDESAGLRYVRWLSSVAKGDLGFSFAYNRPVTPLLMERATNTLFLGSVSLAVTWMAGLPLGVWSAGRQGKWQDASMTAGIGALHTVPDILFAILFLMLAARTGWLPGGGMRSLGYEEMSASEKAIDLARHLALPVAALALANIPTVVRHVRASMVEAMAQPFVKTATANGVPQSRILWRHALPVALNPLASLFGLSLAGVLSSSLLVEVIMSWPGLGPLLIEAVFARDAFVVIGAVLTSTVLLLFGSLVADIVLRASDPRVRAAA